MEKSEATLMIESAIKSHGIRGLISLRDTINQCLRENLLEGENKDEVIQVKKWVEEGINLILNEEKESPNNGG